MTTTLEEKVSGKKEQGDGGHAHDSHAVHAGHDGHDGHGGHDEHQETPASVKKFYEREKIIDTIIKTTKFVHTEVYTEMANKLDLFKNGEVDTSKLDDKHVWGQAVDVMVEAYLKKAAERLGAPLPSRKKGEKMSEEDQTHEDVILSKYFDITRATLMTNLYNHGSRYDSSMHQNIMNDQHTQALEKDLRPLAHQHFTKNELEAIVKYMKAEEILDVNHLKKQPQNIGTFLRLHRDNKGSLPYNVLVQNEKLLEYVKDSYHKKDITKPEHKEHAKKAA